MNSITIENATKLMKFTNGRIFSVSFVKKDGSTREMTCRLGVKKHLKGGELSYDPSEYDLKTVFDLQKNQYRMINLDTLLSITIDGVSYKVV